MSKGRSSSAPARVRGPPQPHVAAPDLSHSNGAGGNSPTGAIALQTIRSALLNTMIVWLPRVEVEEWGSLLYGIIWWEPQGTIRGMMRPRMWHTTLVRADPGLRGSGPFRARFDALNLDLTNTLQALIAGVQSPNGTVLSWITLPPWRASWNFGTPDRMSWICEPLMLIIEGVFRQIDNTVHLRERRPFHISWH
jgi:hypothetical protein